MLWVIRAAEPSRHLCLTTVEDDDAIQKEVIGLVNSIRLANQTRDMTKIADENQKLAIYAQANVDQQVNKIMAEYSVKAKIQKQKLYVVGMVFDIHGVYGGKFAQCLHYKYQWHNRHR